MMNDYKELVVELRKWQTLGDAPVGDGFGVIVDMLTLKQAADAIEQLVKERDEAVADLKENRVCTVCVFGNDDTLFPCEDCCAYTGNYFEWRGVQEDNDAVD